MSTLNLLIIKPKETKSAFGDRKLSSMLFEAVWDGNLAAEMFTLGEESVAPNPVRTGITWRNGVDGLVGDLQRAGYDAIILNGDADWILESKNTLARLSPGTPILEARACRWYGADPFTLQVLSGDARKVSALEEVGLVITHPGGRESIVQTAQAPYADQMGGDIHRPRESRVNPATLKLDTA